MEANKKHTHREKTMRKAFNIFYRSSTCHPIDMVITSPRREKGAPHFRCHFPPTSWSSFAASRCNHIAKYLWVEHQDGKVRAAFNNSFSQLTDEILNSFRQLVKTYAALSFNVNYSTPRTWNEDDKFKATQLVNFPVQKKIERESSSDEEEGNGLKELLMSLYG